MLRIEQIAELLGVHRSTIERLVAQGLPCLDVGIRHPGRRPKRVLRFDKESAMRWLAERAERS